MGRHRVDNNWGGNPDYLACGRCNSQPHCQYDNVMTAVAIIIIAITLGIAFRVRNAILAAFIAGVVVGMSAHVRIYW